MTTKASLNVYKIPEGVRKEYAAALLELMKLDAYLFRLLAVPSIRRQISLADYVCEVSGNFVFILDSSLQTQTMDFDEILKRADRVSSWIQYHQSEEILILQCEWLAGNGEVLGALRLSSTVALRLKMKFARRRFPGLPLGV